MVPAEAQNETDARLPPGLLTSTLVMSLKTGRPIYKSDFVDEETLETLYDQVLVEIYKRAGVTSFLHGHLPNYHKATRKMLMSGHWSAWARLFTKSPQLQNFPQTGRTRL
ncbi:hypothetical protein BFJ71_g2747 [Fusarium oxysporum]|nr:hypothetical protein BFJ71_g2747 [Fusarium oxysporum]